MRSIIKMLGLAFFATLAFSAVGGALGAGPASALLFLTTANPELVEVKSLGTAILESKVGTKVECESVLGDIFVLNKTDSTHPFALTFHGCKSGTSQCTTSGEPVGLIKTLALIGLLVTLLSSIDKYGLKVSAEKGNLAEFSCGTISTVVKGTVVGEFKETLAESEKAKTEAKLEFAKGAGTGEPAIKSYWTLQGTAGAKLESSFTGGSTFEEANQQAVADLVAAHSIEFCHK